MMNTPVPTAHESAVCAAPLEKPLAPNSPPIDLHAIGFRLYRRRVTFLARRMPEAFAVSTAEGVQQGAEDACSRSLIAMVLVLADGTVFSVGSIGLRREARGKVVFSTGMVGYVETLTEPSSQGQIRVATCPLNEANPVQRHEL
jgi:hypothetical protein